MIQLNFPNKEFKGSPGFSGGKKQLKNMVKREKTVLLSFSYDQHGDPIIDTIPKVDTIYLMKDLSPPAKKSPTQAQLDTWKDSKMYGVWIDETG